MACPGGGSGGGAGGGNLAKEKQELLSGVANPSFPSSYSDAVVNQTMKWAYRGLSDKESLSTYKHVISKLTPEQKAKNKDIINSIADRESKYWSRK